LSLYSFHDPRLAFDEESHTYLVDGMEAPSVTRLLRYLMPDDFAQHFTPESAARGQRVHRMIQLDIEGNLDVASLDDELLSYYEGWSEFRFKARFEPELVEQPVFHESLIYAGRLDLYGKLDGKPTLIDIKTGVVSKVAGPQTAAYLMAAAKMGLMPYTTRRFVLDVKPGRSVLTQEYTNAFDKDNFLRALGCFDFAYSRFGK
jgi:hypothetical protein